MSSIDTLARELSGLIKQQEVERSTQQSTIEHLSRKLDNIESMIASRFETIENKLERAQFHPDTHINDTDVIINFLESGNFEDAFNHVRIRFFLSFSVFSFFVSLLRVFCFICRWFVLYFDALLDNRHSSWETQKFLLGCAKKHHQMMPYATLQKRQSFVLCSRLIFFFPLLFLNNNLIVYFLLFRFHVFVCFLLL